jgi:hypothetical protein
MLACGVYDAGDTGDVTVPAADAEAPRTYATLVTAVPELSGLAGDGIPPLPLFAAPLTGTTVVLVTDDTVGVNAQVVPALNSTSKLHFVVPLAPSLDLKLGVAPGMGTRTVVVAYGTVESECVEISQEPSPVHPDAVLT